MADIVRISNDYNMIEHINSFTKNGIVMSKSEWKQIVNHKVKDNENNELKATSLLNDFKSTSINLKTECPL